MYNLEANSEYREMFPNKQDRLDLHVIGSRCEEGCYEGPSKLLILFDDLYRMCSNGKKFNSSNEGFQPWTLADMMEKTVSTLQDTLSHGKYSASNLTNGTSSSRIEMRSHNSMPLNENGSKYGDLKDPYEDDEETGVRRSLELEEV